ncbi:STAS domain-containing protein [Actinophytocola sp.]|uniref:STAS domain-containing protein n=1 Tax=Actinophytocola sp. TaxID=1872138 RepID=UPI003899F739
MSQKTVPATYRVTAHECLTVRTIREHSDTERVTLAGEIDLCTAPLLRAALADTDAREVPNVLVDLSQVHFMALAGVHLLREASERRAAAGRRLVVAAPTSTVQRTLTLTEAALTLEIYVSAHSALSALAV